MEARLNQTILQGGGCRWRPFPPLYNGCLHGNKLSKPQTCVKCIGRRSRLHSLPFSLLSVAKVLDMMDREVIVWR
jgi:hypothetical protein